MAILNALPTGQVGIGGGLQRGQIVGQGKTVSPNAPKGSPSGVMPTQPGVHPGASPNAHYLNNRHGIVPDATMRALGLPSHPLMGQAYNHGVGGSRS